VLDFPTWDAFRNELGRGYTHVGISFIQTNVMKVKRMTEYIRTRFPEIKILLGGYGVSLLNDCKYGHDIRDNVIRISLLRSPTDPDLQADQGEHRFAFSLLPHTDRWDARTVGAAYALNDPLLVVDGVAYPAQPVQPALLKGIVYVDRPNAVIETIKRAEDGEGVIVRLYESQRKRGPITLTAGFPLRAAWRTNLLEENLASISAHGSAITLNLRPFEIVTLRLVPA